MSLSTLIKSSNSVSNIQKKSSSFVDVFTKTIEGLTNLNETINTEKIQRKTEIERLTSEHEELQKLQDVHTKVISKINKIFED